MSEQRRQTVMVGVLVALLGVLWWVTQRSVAAFQEPLSEPQASTVSSPDGAGSVRYSLARRDGTPVRWDPCTPIGWVANVDGAPYRTSLDDITAAFARVSEVSGLRFEYLGESDEVPTDDREPFQPERYGDRWAPVLVAWADASTIPTLAGDAVGAARAVPAGRRAVYVSGEIYLDAGHSLRPGYGLGSAWGTIVMHEVGHLVGLEHVDDEGEIMHPGGARTRVAGTVNWGPGDRAGLTTLGVSSGCQDAPAPPS